MHRLSSGRHRHAGPEAGSAPAAERFQPAVLMQVIGSEREYIFFQAAGDTLDRKRAVFLLRAMSAAAAAPPLATLLQLYETLDEFPLHLVEVRHCKQLLRKSIASDTTVLPRTNCDGALCIQLLFRCFICVGPMCRQTGARSTRCIQLPTLSIQSLKRSCRLSGWACCGATAWFTMRTRRYISLTTADPLSLISAGMHCTCTSICKCLIVNITQNLLLHVAKVSC